MSPATHNPNAKPHPDCAACKQNWPIHEDEAGKRFHIDLFTTQEHGTIADCPTPVWFDETDDEEESK